MYKRNQNRIEKIIKLYENIKNQSVLLETNDFNEEQIMEFLKKFCSLKHQQFLFQSRIDVFDNDCYPVIKNILEENISKKNTLVLKIAEFFKPKLTGFPNFFQECLLNFDEECYSIVKEINKDLQN